MKLRLRLVENWRALWKSSSIWAMVTGIFLPEILEWAADHVSALPFINDGYKSLIRLAFLVAAIGLRFIKQNSVSGVKNG
jgi:fucose 4-O-acetylase-like acetyltransferase